MEMTANPIPPIVMLQVLHMCYPQFAEKAEGGQGYQQQVQLKTRVVGSSPSTHYSFPRPLENIKKIMYSELHMERQSHAGHYPGVDTV